MYYSCITFDLLLTTMYQLDIYTDKKNGPERIHLYFPHQYHVNRQFVNYENVTIKKNAQNII
jgi:hypothetical protein